MCAACPAPEVPETTIQFRQMSIRVAIIEDNTKVRNNLTKLIEVSSGFECVSAYPSAEAALAELPEVKPDVVLMDINLGRGLSGIDVARRLGEMVDIPVIYVNIHLEGISPEDAERLLVKPIEQEMRGIEGVKEMRSIAFQGGGNLVLEFDAGFDAGVDAHGARGGRDVPEPRAQFVFLARASTPAETATTNRRSIGLVAQDGDTKQAFAHGVDLVD